MDADVRNALVWGGVVLVPSLIVMALFGVTTGAVLAAFLTALILSIFMIDDVIRQKMSSKDC